MCDLKKYKSKIIYSIIQLIPFLILYILSNTILKELYLFEWTARNLYCYIWIIIILLTFANKMILSISLVASNFLGILLGQFLGDWIRYTNIQTITPDMTAEQEARLHLHPGFEIWLVTILCFFIISLIVHKYNKKKQVLKKLD